MQKTIPRNTEYHSSGYDHERYVNLSVQWNRWLLKPFGLWPNSETISISRKCFYRLINTTCYGLIGFLFVPCSLFVFLEVENLYDKLKQFGPLIFCIMAFAKYYYLLIHEADIRECVERIEWDWRNVQYNKDRDVMIVNASFGRKLVIICTFFMYSGFAFYYIAIPTSVGKITEENENLTFIPLVFPFSKYVIDTKHSPANEIVFLIQLVAGVLVHGITTAACSLAAAFAVHACGQMQIVMNWLEQLIDGRSDMNDEVDGRIASIVCHHVRVLRYDYVVSRCLFLIHGGWGKFRSYFRFLMLTKKVLQQISFVEFLGCTLDICLAGYYAIVESKSNDVTSAMTYVVFVISLTFNIFIFCYIGEIVNEQCSKIGETAYMIQWYRLPGNKKLCCILIIAMSNCSTKLTAGNIVELSISTFADVIKSAVAFLNVLRTLT